MYILFIVDPQNDFIEGGKLPVKGGTKALENIAHLILKDRDKISSVITSQDWHPGNHKSFIEFGGTFPEHCVERTWGSEIYLSISEAIDNSRLELFSLYKGVSSEQYSAIIGSTVEYRNTIELETAENGSFSVCKDTEIVVCGLAGDICVYNTICSLLNAGLNKISVYLKGTASLDNGNKLNELITSKKLKIYDVK